MPVVATSLLVIAQEVECLHSPPPLQSIDQTATKAISILQTNSHKKRDSSLTLTSVAITSS